MIYQACGLDKKILVPKNEVFLAGGGGFAAYSLRKPRLAFEATLTAHGGVCLAKRVASPRRVNHAKGVYIINAKHCISPTRSVVYHQAAGRYTLKRDEIQGRCAALDDIPTCVG